MRRTKAVQAEVRAPDKGLRTALPPTGDSAVDRKYVVDAENVRAEFGMLRSAFGYTRAHTTPTNLDSPANLIFQASVTGVDPELRTALLVGTEGKLYLVNRRARTLDCTLGPCQITFAVVGNTGKVGQPFSDVVDLVKGWSPDFIVHTGDLVFSDAGLADDDKPYEELVGKQFNSFIGGYGGLYGAGPSTNAFFPVPGDHDYTDGPSYRYFSFFTLPTPERYYTVRRGPAQFFFITSYGPQTGSSSEGESDLTWPTSPVAEWLADAVDASDATWKIVVFHHPGHTSSSAYSPGQTIMRWPWSSIGVDLVLNGHAQNYERLIIDDVTRVIVGNGGHALAGFTTPVTGSEVRNSAVYGALKVVVSHESLTGTAYSVAGVEIDSFTLTPQRDPVTCYISDAAREVLSVEIIPDTVTVEVGAAFQLRALARYTDGSSEDVTFQAAWTSSDTSVVFSGSGKAIGNTVGSATVTVEFSGASDTAIVLVVAQCLDEPADALLVLDKSGSMDGHSGTSSRIKRLKEACALFFDKLLVSGSPAGPDRAGVLTFSGDYAAQTGNASVVAPLGSSTTVLKAAVEAITPYGGTGIADALTKAAAEMASDRVLTGHRPVVILFTDGFANISDAGQALLPGATETQLLDEGADAATAAADSLRTSLEAAGGVLMVVGLDLSYNLTRRAVVQAWASTGFFYSVDDADNLSATFDRLLGDVCRDDAGDPGVCIAAEFVGAGPDSGATTGTHGVVLASDVWVSLEYQRGDTSPVTETWIGTYWHAVTNVEGDGPTPTFTLESGSLPAGTSLVAATSGGRRGIRLSGTPAAAGTYPLVLRVSNPCTSPDAEDVTFPLDIIID